MACPAVRVLDLAIRPHPQVSPRPEQSNLPCMVEVLFEHLLHLRPEAPVLGHQIDLPIGSEAAEVQVSGSLLRPPAVSHDSLGVYHRAAVLEDTDTRFQKLPVAGTR